MLFSQTVRLRAVQGGVQGQFEKASALSIYTGQDHFNQADKKTGPHPPCLSPKSLPPSLLGDPMS